MALASGTSSMGRRLTIFCKSHAENLKNGLSLAATLDAPLLEVMFSILQRQRSLATT